MRALTPRPIKKALQEQREEIRPGLAHLLWHCLAT